MDCALHGQVIAGPGHNVEQTKFYLSLLYTKKEKKCVLSSDGSSSQRAHPWVDETRTKISATSYSNGHPLFVNILFVRHILDDVCRFHQFLCIRVWNLETKLILNGHDDFDTVQAVQAQVIDEM